MLFFFVPLHVFTSLLVFAGLSLFVSMFLALSFLILALFQTWIFFLSNSLSVPLCDMLVHHPLLRNSTAAVSTLIRYVHANISAYSLYMLSSVLATSHSSEISMITGGSRRGRWDSISATAGLLTTLVTFQRYGVRLVKYLLTPLKPTSNATFELGTAIVWNAAWNFWLTAVLCLGGMMLPLLGQ